MTPDNPLVFPSNMNRTHDGIALRDYFAAKAMQAMCAGEGALMVAARDERYDETNWAQVVALNAYEIADAMLAERQRRAIELEKAIHKALSNPRQAERSGLE